MPFRYFEHEADVGIIGEGRTLAKAFEEAAKAMFNVMSDIKKVEAKKKVKIKAKAKDQEALFVEFLNELIAQRDIHNMMFSKFKVKISKNNLTGEARGETIDIKKHRIKTEVKAASYSQLKITKKTSKYIARCVVDV